MRSTGLVWYHHWTSLVGLSSSWPWPDKSGTHALEAGESFWKMVISLDKSSEHLEKDFLDG
jgi:hypothetical protein